MKKITNTVVCNICGKDININDFGYIDDYLNIGKRWGYGSEYDNEVHEFNICQDCYKELIKNMKIKPILHN